MTVFTPETVTIAQIAKLIDHSLLRPELTLDDVRVGCQLATRYQVASVCVRPADVTLAADFLRGTDVLVGTVAGFPHGSTSTEIKAAETALAVSQGAAEVDMVINIGWLRSGHMAEVEAEIRTVVHAANGATLKVIFENAYLTDEQIVAGCQAVERAGADFVKTSTGFAAGGATMEDLALMRSSVSSTIGVKAAGGVRTLDTLLAMVNIGVTRFGATATAAILDDLAHRQKHGRPAAEAAASTGGY
jgi:deoxyribose-phosphate aldolase